MAAAAIAANRSALLQGGRQVAFLVNRKVYLNNKHVTFIDQNTIVLDTDIRGDAVMIYDQRNDFALPFAARSELVAKKIRLAKAMPVTPRGKSKPSLTGEDDCKIHSQWIFLWSESFVLLSLF